MRAVGLLLILAGGVVIYWVVEGVTKRAASTTAPSQTPPAAPGQTPQTQQTPARPA